MFINKILGRKALVPCTRLFQFVDATAFFKLSWFLACIQIQQSVRIKPNQNAYEK